MTAAPPFPVASQAAAWTWEAPAPGPAAPKACGSHSVSLSRVQLGLGAGRLRTPCPRLRTGGPEPVTHSCVPSAQRWPATHGPCDSFPARPHARAHPSSCTHPLPLHMPPAKGPRLSASVRPSSVVSESLPLSMAPAAGLLRQVLWEQILRREFVYQRRGTQRTQPGLGNRKSQARGGFPPNQAAESSPDMSASTLGQGLGLCTGNPWSLAKGHLGAANSQKLWLPEGRVQASAESHRCRPQEEKQTGAGGTLGIPPEGT